MIILKDDLLSFKLKKFGFKILGYTDMQKKKCQKP